MEPPDERARVENEMIDIVKMAEQGLISIAPEDLAELKKQRAEANEHRAALYKKTQNALLCEDDVEALRILSDLMSFLGSTDRPFVFLRLAKIMSSPTFWRATHAHWNVFDRIPHRDFSKLFRKHRPQWKPDYMRDEDADAYAKLPETVTVYRGQDAGSRAGLSWTLNRDTAEEFARGHRGLFNASPIVIEARVAKMDVAAFYGDRNENEIVLFTATATKGRTIRAGALQKGSEKSRGKSA